MNLLDLMIKVGVDDQASDGIAGIAGKVSSMADGIGNVLSTAAKVGTAAVGAATAGVGALTKAAVDSYADYEQLVGGVETLFKDSADIVQAYASGAFRTAGLSANEYMETVTSFSASLLQSLDGDTAAAAAAAQEAIVDMADNANKMGTSMSMIQNAYQGFAKQNYSMLDNLKLGFGGTQEEMYRLLQTAAELDTTFASTAEFSLDAKGHLTAEFADITKAIHIVQTEMGITGTTAAEAASTISGSMAAAKSAWQNFLTGLADENADLSALTENLVGSVSVAADNLLPRLQQFVSGIMNAFGELTGIDLSGFVSSVSSGIGQAVTLVDELGDAFADSGVAGAVDVLVSRFEALTGIDLSGAASSVLSLASAFGEFAVGKIESTASAISTIFAPFRENAAPVIEAVTGAVTGFLGATSGFSAGGLQIVAGSVAQLLEPFAPAIAPIITGVGDAVAGFFGLLAGFSSGPLITVADAAVKLLSPFVSGLADLIVGIAGAIGELFGYANEKVSGPLQTIADLVARLFGVFTPELQGFIDNVVTALKAFITAVGKKAIDNVGKFAAALEFVYRMLEPIITYIWDAITAVAEFVAALLTSEGDIKKIMKAIGKLFGDSARSVIDLWGTVIDFFKGLPDKILGFFSGIGQRFSGIGAEIVAGIQSGLSNAWEGLKSFASGLWDGLTGTAEEANEIHSPSRVYYRIARQMIDGAVVGWRENFGRLQDLVETDFAALAPAGSAMVPTARVDFSESAIGKSSAAAMNTLLAASYSENREIRIPLYLNGREIAQATYRDLEQITRQRGE